MPVELALGHGEWVNRVTELLQWIARLRDKLRVNDPPNPDTR
jgi:hypothetical protein